MCGRAKMDEVLGKGRRYTLQKKVQFLPLPVPAVRKNRIETKKVCVIIFMTIVNKCKYYTKVAFPGFFQALIKLLLTTGKLHDVFFKWLYWLYGT